MIITLSVVSYLKFKQTITPRPYRISVASNLVFRQTIKHNIRTRTVSSKLNFTQGVSYQRSVANLSVGHTLNFYQVVSKNPIYLDVTQHHFMWQTIGLPKVESVEHQLSLVQNIVAHRANAVKDTLTWTQEIGVNLVRTFEIEHTLNTLSSISAWLTNPDFNYLNPVISVQDKVRFRYKGQDLYYRKPDFDDSYEYAFTRLERRSRGGDLIISRDSQWPQQKTFKVTFSYLSDGEIQSLLELLRTSVGKSIDYLNYDGIEWRGYIMSPQAEVTQAGRHNRTLAIEFQGEPI